jgi:ferrous iron transport protein B
MMLGMAIPTSVSPVVASYLASIGVARILVEIIAEVLLASFGFCLAMVGFVLGVSFVFGLMEETGLMARISYVFDDTMHGMGLQGKSLMPILVSFGCNMAGTAAGRVIDSWGQKTLTIAMAWAIPCGASWSVFGLLASTFFAGEAPIVMVAFFLVLLFQIRLTAKVFSSRLVPENTQQGLIMELPPYHRPRWLDLLKFVFARFFKVFKKAFSVVFFVCLFIWALSYSASDNPQGSLLVRFGTAVEPVTIFFGLRWQLFVAWICSAMGKESAVGVLAALFSVSDNGIFLSEAMKYAGGTGLGAAMAAAVTKPEALAFLFAFMFNIPCFMTVISTNQEIHSWKWTLRIALFYIVSALVYAFVAYHVGLLIWR